jgi:CTD nuclear envelope phosphatase 1
VRCPYATSDRLTWKRLTTPSDNAIPIEGWISDPTDYELLHLIPLLEGLQYVTDVRALLALRQGMPSSA